MSGSFLTLEDVNGVLYGNQKFWWHEIDTWEISETEDFTDIKYDGFEVTRVTYPGEGYTFFVKPKNSFFANAGYVLSKNGSSISTIPVLASGKLKIDVSLSYPSLRIFLYMGLMPVTPDFDLFPYRLKTETLNLNLKQLNSPQSIKLIFNMDGEELTVSKTLTQGFNLIEHSHMQCGYLLVNLLKTDFRFNCTQSLVVGKVNKVLLGTDSDYKPSGDMIGSYAPTITVQYKGETLPVTWDSVANDYVFQLDLTEKANAGKVRFTVNVEANDVINTSSNDVVLNSDYATISTFANLVSACGDNGTDIIRLGADLTATSNILITHPIKIIGNEHTIDLDNHSFILNDSVSLIAENIVFDSGDTTIKQAPNSKVELTNCTFNECTSSNYNGLGSCIYCDIDIDSLEILDDFTTNLTDCTFTNNTSAILHGGELIITDCKLHNTDITKTNKNNVAFLYQVDGRASIRNSVFDIDYTATTLCDNSTTIGYAQALIMTGETATINGASHTELSSDNSLPFHDAPYNNRSHIFAKYYYNQISNCVYASPTPNNEDKACCHSVSGVDWIYKNNVQITRADTGNENTNRKIRWD